VAQGKKEASQVWGNSKKSDASELEKGTVGKKRGGKNYAYPVMRAEGR